MNNGKQFETQFQKSCKKQGIFCLKLKDKSSYITMNKDANFSKNICDFIIHYNKRMFALELKTTQSTSISFNQPPFVHSEKSVGIQSHQVAGLMEVNSYEIDAGLIINFKARQTKRKSIEENTFYIPIQSFVRFCDEFKDKNSINLHDCEEIGLKIDSKVLRVHSEYYIKEMLDNY